VQNILSMTRGGLFSRFDAFLLLSESRFDSGGYEFRVKTTISFVSETSGARKGRIKIIRRKCVAYSGDVSICN
jgi:hypothetical protein